MEDSKKTQWEALATLKEFNVKLLHALGGVIDELEGEEKEDTWEYLDYIFKSMNWELQVINGTLDLLNMNENLIDKKNINAMIERVNIAYTGKKRGLLAQIISGELIPFFDELQKIINERFANI
ncbi:molecular chaperone [Lachnospiraceae bacterium OttesenSCG-928-D06]|nr:molecular chaperone [Lachnospiraceae bacterium OttesenSCG-928-D06]